MSKVLLFMVVAMMFSCKTASTQKTMDKVVTPAEFEVQMQEFDSLGITYLLLDIRTADELDATGIIPGASHIDFYGENFQAEVEKLDKKTPVMMYCRSGGRSGKARNLFVELGFEEVYDLDGGITDWTAAGKPVEK